MYICDGYEGSIDYTRVGFIRFGSSTPGGGKDLVPGKLSIPSQFIQIETIHANERFHLQRLFLLLFVEDPTVVGRAIKLLGKDISSIISLYSYLKSLFLSEIDRELPDDLACDSHHRSRRDPKYFVTFPT
jgi:hypothetical protein